VWKVIQYGGKRSFARIVHEMKPPGCEPPGYSGEARSERWGAGGTGGRTLDVSSNGIPEGALGEHGGGLRASFPIDGREERSDHGIARPPSLRAITLLRLGLLGLVRDGGYLWKGEAQGGLASL